jgi:hypothetical protein
VPIAGRLLVAMALPLVLLAPGVARAQSDRPDAPLPIATLVNQLTDFFPKVQGEVLEVRGSQLTLDVGKKDGVRAGLDLEVYREGREIRHPRTGQLLGRTEETLGRISVSQVQEQFSLARLVDGEGIRPGDRFRLSAAKIPIVLLALAGPVRDTLVEAATQELVERLGATGRFQVTMGDAIGIHLAERGVKAEQVLAGQGLAGVAERFKVEHVLAVHFKRVEAKPFMEVRFFALPRPEPAIATAFFVPPSLRAPPPGTRFSASGRSTAPQARPRSLLAWLLGGDVDPGSYSSAESAMPLREVARFGFPVLAMDVAVAPRDRLPHVVVSDGETVSQYRIVDRKLEPEWTFSARGIGRVFSLHLADLDGDGVLEVVGNRSHPKAGLSSFVLQAKDGRPRYLADQLSMFLFPVDLTGSGVKQTLWAQRHSREHFFTPGQADQAVIRNGELVVERAVRVPADFRPMGAAFSNIMGKDTRVLAFVDPSNRLQVASEGEQFWWSTTSVGGGSLTLEQEVYDILGGRSKFYKIEPTPLAVDLDGDGIDELVVPQNVVKEGLLAVVFRGPAGFVLQSVNTGFEGGITALGAFKTDDATQPTLVISVVRFDTFLKRSGETQVIMTIPQY